MALPRIRWLYDAASCLNDLWWRDMAVGIQLLCERKLQSSKCGDSKVYYSHRNVLYVADLVTMTQLNLSTGRLRRIRRVEESFAIEQHRVSFIRFSPDAHHEADNGFREVESFGFPDEEKPEKHVMTRNLANLGGPRYSVPKPKRPDP